MCVRVRFTFQKRVSLFAQCICSRFHDILVPKVAVLRRNLYKMEHETLAHVLLGANLLIA